MEHETCLMEICVRDLFFVCCYVVLLFEKKDVHCDRMCALLFWIVIISYGFFLFFFLFINFVSFNFLTVSPPNINDVYESTTTSTMEQYTFVGETIVRQKCYPSDKICILFIRSHYICLCRQMEPGAIYGTMFGANRIHFCNITT